MGLRLYAIYPNIDDTVTYTVNIYDEGYVSSASEVRLSGQVEYEFLGSSRDPLQKIIPTNARFTFLVNTQAIQDFVDALILSEDGRFWVKILRGSDVDFIGQITADQTEMVVRPLDSNEREYTITAYDGLSRLKDIPYRAAQGQAFIDQSRDGKFKVKPSSSQIYDRAGAATYHIWDDVVENIGTKWNVAGKYFIAAGTYNFKAYVSVLFDLYDFWVSTGYDLVEDNDFVFDNNDGFNATFTLYKLDVNGDPVNIGDPQVMDFKFIADGIGFTSQRITASFDAKDIVLRESEKVLLKVEIDNVGDYAKVTFESNSYFENIIDAIVTVKNAYDSVINHIKNVFDNLPTIGYYAAGDFFLIDIPHTETNQGSADSEAYIGVPYNAFVTDVFADPPTVISCYEVLEALIDLLPGQLIYRQGLYIMHPYHNATSFNVYSTSFAKTGTTTKAISASVMQREGSGSQSYLMPIHRAQLCYKRKDSNNIFSEEVGSKLPTITYLAYVTTSEVSLTSDRSYYLHVIIRVSKVLKHASLQTLEDDEETWRHQFSFIVKAGTDYLRARNLNTFLNTDPIYEVPRWGTAYEPIQILGPSQTAIKEHTIEFKAEIPGIDYDGELEIALDYTRTIVRVDVDEYTIVTIPYQSLAWATDKLRLSTSDAAEQEKIYDVDICTTLQRPTNTFSIDRQLKFSDLWVKENDPGAVRVLDGSDWVLADTWGGVSLQMKMTQYLANPFITPAQIFNGLFITGNPTTGHANLRTGELMLLLTGSYHTHLNRLQGSWWTYTTVDKYLQLGASTQVGKSVVSNESRGGSNPDGAPTPSETGSQNREQYYFYVNDQTTVYIAVDPAVYRLPDPADYSEADMMRMFNGSKKGSGNLTYRETLARPEHFKVDFANDRIELFRAAENGVDYFFMWEIL